MAKKTTSNPKTETAARIQRTEAYANQVRALFVMTVNQILALNKTVPQLEPGVMFSFDAQSLKIQKEVERLLRQLHSVATMAIQNGIKLEWGQANLAADQLVKSIIGKELFSNPTFNAWTARNEAAMQKFINRSERGFNLSDRVWKSVRQLRDEMEVAITVAVGEGKSAQKMSQDVRKYLNDPDLMFRRFRYKKAEEIQYDENGNEIGKKIIWGKKWKKRIKKPDGTYGWIDYDRDSYKTGAGVYKSSAKNAMRVARSETNIAYRRADNERWNQMDFVLGQRINLSGNHPAKDICDKLAGDYPKEFLFDGWHPQCFCYVTPITLPPEETAHLTEKMLKGEDWRAELAKLKRGREITQYPDNFKTWVVENKGKILNAHDNGTDPYFIRNNFKAINAILNPDSKDAQELLQKEQQARIKKAQHAAELEAKSEESSIIKKINMDKTILKVGKIAIPLSQLISESTEIPTKNGKVFLHPNHGKNEKQENLEVAKFLANKLGYEILLLEKVETRNLKEADTFNITLNRKEEYKVNNTPSYNAIDRLIRDGAKQSKNIVLKLESNISLEIVSKALNDRVKRTTIKTVQIIKGNEWAEFSREDIIKNNFKIQPEDFI